MNIIYKTASKLSIVILLVAMVSCNKDVPAPVPITFPAPSGSSIAEVLTADTSYSFLLAAVTKVGLATAVSNKNAVFTVFAPNNNAMRQFINIASGGLIPTNAPNSAFLNFINNQIPLSTLSSVINYHIVPGKPFASAQIPTTFPNLRLPTNFAFPAPNTNPLVRFTVFPSKRGTSSAWVNNIPVDTVDINAANGVIHGVRSVLVPPSRILLDTLERDPELSFLIAAIKRADTGRNITLISDSSLQYFIGNPTAAVATNFTVFAPVNDAFKGLLNVLSGGAIPLNAPDAAFIGFINTLPPLTLRGILAYHVLSQRAFSVNFNASPGTSYLTLLNGNVPTHPGLIIYSTQVNRFGIGLSVKGVANATAASAVPPLPNPLVDRHAINGVFYKINQVLLPQ